MVHHNPDLTASEIAHIWESYMADTMTICIMNHFLTNVEDEEIKEIIQHTKALSEGHLNSLASILEKEGIPLPQGFTEHDLNANAPRLFSDVMYLRYLKYMGKTGADMNSMAFGTSFREDIRAYFMSALKESADLYDRVIRLMEAKGLLTRTPFIAYPEKAEFIQDDEGFLGGYLTLQKRPLLAMEVTHLANNIDANSIGKKLMDGFAQVCESKEVRDHLQNGSELAYEIIKTLEEKLEENETDPPVSSDVVITDSTVAPFSDKLIVCLTSSLTALSITKVGQAISASPRSDLIAEYTQLTAQILKYSSAGAKISIKNNWLEKPPQTLDRKKLMEE